MTLDPDRNGMLPPYSQKTAGSTIQHRDDPSFKFYKPDRKGSKNRIGAEEIKRNISTLDQSIDDQMDSI